jgi:hypothetical protein
MFFSKLKTMMAVAVALVVLCAGSALFWPSAPAASAEGVYRQAPVPAPVPQDKAKPDDKKDDKKPEKKDAPSFTGIVIEGASTVTIRQNNKEDVQLRNETLAQRIENGVLYLSGAGTATVDVKELARLEVRGAALVEGKDLKAKTLTLILSGAGTVTLTGTIDEQTLTVPGAATLNCEALKGKSANVNVSGSGNVLVNVSEKLIVDISGTGAVEYLGSPKVEENITGSGSVKAQEKQDDKKKDDK